MSRSNRKQQEDAPIQREAPYEEIAQKAYEIYCASGFEDGCADQHWIQAEQELMEGNGSRSSRREKGKSQ